MSIRYNNAGYFPDPPSEFYWPESPHDFTGITETSEYRAEYANTHDVTAALIRALGRDLEMGQSQPPRLSLVEFPVAVEPIVELEPTLESEDLPSAARPLAARCAVDLENLRMIVELHGDVEIEPYLKRITRAYNKIKNLLAQQRPGWNRPVQLKLI